MYEQVLVAEDPTNLCTSEATRSARESFIAVRIPSENIMSYMRASLSLYTHVHTQQHQAGAMDIYDKLTYTELFVT